MKIFALTSFAFTFLGTAAFAQTSLPRTPVGSWEGDSFSWASAAVAEKPVRAINPVLSENPSNAELGRAIIAFNTSIIREAQNLDVHFINAFPANKPHCVNMDREMSPFSANYSPNIQSDEEKREEQRLMAETNEKTPALMAAVLEENPSADAMLKLVNEIVTLEMPAALQKEPGEDSEQQKVYQDKVNRYILELTKRADAVQTSIRNSSTLSESDALEVQKLMVMAPWVMQIRFPKQLNFDAECSIETAQYEVGQKIRASLAN